MITPEFDADPPVRGIFAQPMGGPTVVRRLLGARLRRLREAGGVTGEAAGEAIRASASKISRLERGRVGFKERDVLDLLRLYGFDDETEQAGLLELVRQSNTPGWWHHYGDVLPDWYESYIGLEEAAALIRCYEPQSVPGLLQTEAYARALLRLSHPGATTEQIERRVALRMTRQQLLTRTDAPKVWAVMDEAALRRPMGGTDVMRAQLERLLELEELRNVTLQVVPFDTGGHPAISGPFTILRFSEPDLPDIVYLEQLTGAVYLDKREDVDHYLAVLNRLAVQATPPATHGVIATILDGLR
ncbi:transcriptional regulator [Actinomadura craniellae]|uniref:Transcriptional regulator n=1 Tax=Actinomadura craniellae TaxID=2231787 RepID=A0A365H8W3_9ACTN|nr:helix-turn-helix transcriptional regulator [Actinomadura craniellae]RAY15574.1 transcriptional regulator [Actinomadura craniellae]